MRLVTALYLLALFVPWVSGCSTVTMNAEPTEDVTCTFRVPAPFAVKCASSNGKMFEWTGPKALVIEGVCKPCADGSCPSCVE